MHCFFIFHFKILCILVYIKMFKALRVLLFKITMTFNEDQGHPFAQTWKGPNQKTSLSSLVVIIYWFSNCLKSLHLADDDDWLIKHHSNSIRVFSNCQDHEVMTLNCDLVIYLWMLWPIYIYAIGPVLSRNVLTHFCTVFLICSHKVKSKLKKYSFQCTEILSKGR